MVSNGLGILTRRFEYPLGESFVLVPLAQELPGPSPGPGSLPDPRHHLVRYAGAYANRCRKQYRREGHGVRVVPPDPGDPPLPTGNASWARLLRRVFEVDPLTCPNCGAEMRVISVITEPAVIDRIRRQLEKTGREDPFEARAPPAPPAA